MKKTYSGIISFILLLVCSHGLTQQVATQINGYTETYEADSLKKEEIYSKIVDSIAKNFNSSTDVILMNSQDKLIAKGNFILNLNYPFYEFLIGFYEEEVDIDRGYILKISIQDNEYTVELELPEEVKVSRFYGVYIYTDIRERDLFNDYINAEICLSCTKPSGEKKQKRKEKPIQFKCETVKNASEANICLKYKDFSNTQKTSEMSRKKQKEYKEIERYIKFKLNFSTALNEEVCKLYKSLEIN